MYFVFFIEPPANVPLSLILLHERGVGIDTLQILNDTKFFAIVHFVVILYELSHYFFIGYLLADLLRYCWLFGTTFFSLFICLVLNLSWWNFLSRLAFYDLFKGLHLLLLNFCSHRLIFTRVKFDG